MHTLDKKCINWLKHESLHFIVVALGCVFQRAALKYSAAAVRGTAGSQQGANSAHVWIDVPTNIDSVSSAAARSSSMNSGKVSFKDLSHFCGAEGPTIVAAGEERSSFPWAASTADTLSWHPVALQGYQLQLQGTLRSYCTCWVVILACLHGSGDGGKRSWAELNSSGKKLWPT